MTSNYDYREYTSCTVTTINVGTADAAVSFSYVELPPRPQDYCDGCWHAPKEAEGYQSTLPRPMKRWIELKPKSPSSLWHRFIQCQRQK